MKQRRWQTDGSGVFPFDQLEDSSRLSHREALEVRKGRGPAARQPVEYEFDDWTGELGERRIRVTKGSLRIECFGSPSKTRKLYVFMSAGGGKKKDGHTPSFPRSTWHPWLDGVSLNVDDPTYAFYPGMMQTGWYLGTAEEDAVSAVAAVIRKVQRRYRISSKRTYIIGSSAGGYAALKLASEIDGVTAIVENAVVYPHLQPSKRYISRAGVDLDSEFYRARTSLRGIADTSKSKFVILQNSADLNVAEQLNDFLGEIGLPRTKLGLNRSGRMFVFNHSARTISPHHTFLSASEFRYVLRALEASRSDAHLSESLHATTDAARGRWLTEDRVSNLHAWARVLSSLKSDVVVPPKDARDVNVERFVLRACGEIEIRARIGHRARHAFVAVDSRSEAGLDADILKNVARELGGKIRIGDPRTTMSFSYVPLADVGGQIERIAAAIAPRLV